MTDKNTVFLGGTCAGSTWREELIPLLKINHFNPVVEDWDKAARERELEERATTDFCLYYLTPEMKGIYSIAEVVDDSCKRPWKTILYFPWDQEAWGRQMFQSLLALRALVVANGAKSFHDMKNLANYLNTATPRGPKG